MLGIWTNMIHKADVKHRKGIQSLFLLTCWCIWRERNCRTFQRKASSQHAIIARIHDDAHDWSFASAKHLRALLFEPP
jgi:hypothetical protein